MLTLSLVMGTLALCWWLAYTGQALIVWTTLAIVGYAGLAAAGSLQPPGMALLGAAVLLLLFFNLVPLRRALITRPVFRLFKQALPPMSSTEREAIEAGDLWWETQLFRGRPKWSNLLDFQYTRLTPEEQRFLDNECNILCSMVNDWKVEYEDKDLPPEAWQYIREKGFFAMLIPKEHGGMGFSALAQSTVVTKLATRSIALAVTVMVPNSLGPGELLMHYGTPEQKKQWLPGLASGKEIPCFGLTGPEVGSDATALPDEGRVCYGQYEGQRTLGISLSFSKRWITLAPVATVVGLAFRLRDPDGLMGDVTKTDYGITCALVPATHPGVKIGRRHYPGSAFMNGPIFGKDVFIPIDWIIGGPAMAGKGWRMLVECLSAGRGISLPALATAAGQVAYQLIGSYGRIRRQFRVSIGQFEGVQEVTGRIAGMAYTLEAMRTLTASAVDHCAPSVVTALAKYHMTEIMRGVVIDAMDVLAGRGIQQGPRNPFASAWKTTPIAITVEGANILTRNLMIFGQGAIRCHEYIFAEMEAARADDLAKFDRLLFGHIGFAINRGVRAFTLGLTNAALARSPVPGPMAPYFRQMERMSAALAFCSDVTMGLLGGGLKRKERMSARLGDVLSQLYIASAVAKYYLHHGTTKEDLAHARWALDNAFYEIGKAFRGFFVNFPIKWVGPLLGWLIFPFGSSYRPLTDELTSEIANQLMQPSVLRARLTQLVYHSEAPDDPLGRIERAYKALLKVEVPYTKFLRAAGQDELAGSDTTARIADAQAKGLLTAEEAALLREYDRLRYDAILTDDFRPEYLLGDFDAEDDGLTGAAARVG